MNKQDSISKFEERRLWFNKELNLRDCYIYFDEGKAKHAYLDDKSAPALESIAQRLQNAERATRPFFEFYKHIPAADLKSKGKSPLKIKKYQFADLFCADCYIWREQYHYALYYKGKELCSTYNKGWTNIHPTIFVKLAQECPDVYNAGDDVTEEVYRLYLRLKNN